MLARGANFAHNTEMGERARELSALIIGDIICFSLALWLTLLVRYLEWPTAERVDDHFGPFFLLALIWVLVFYIAGLYDKHTVFLKNLMLSRIVKTQITNVILAAVVFFVIPFGIAPKTNLVIYLLISIALVTIWRLYIYNFLSPKTKHRAILIAEGNEALDLAHEINNNNRYNYSFVHFLNEDTMVNTPNFEGKLLQLIDDDNIDIIVADYRSEHIQKFLPFIFDLSFLKFNFTLLDFYQLYEDTFDRVPMSSLRYDWFINNISNTKNTIYGSLKRVIDIVGAVVLFIPTGILFPFIILLVKLEDKGEIFYFTERVGQFNRPIRIIKFRTMTGQDVGQEALHSKLKVTRVGAFLRKTRLDELPQLWNILKGDLSFIGPRPEMPALASAYAEQIPYYNMRHFIKPGLSGWAQINHFDAPRQGVDVDRTKTKLSYDLHYLRCRSLMFDIEIMLKTVRILIMRSGT